MEKVIAIGIGYKNLRMVNGEYKGTKYEFPIYTERDVEIVRSSGGEIKA